jgi:hypothetical protein
MNFIHLEISWIFHKIAMWSWQLGNAQPNDKIDLRIELGKMWTFQFSTQFVKEELPKRKKFKIWQN